MTNNQIPAIQVDNSFTPEGDEVLKNQPKKLKNETKEDVLSEILEVKTTTTEESVLDSNSEVDNLDINPTQPQEIVVEPKTALPNDMDESAGLGKKWILIDLPQTLIDTVSLRNQAIIKTVDFLLQKDKRAFIGEPTNVAEIERVTDFKFYKQPEDIIVRLVELKKFAVGNWSAYLEHTGPVKRFPNQLYDTAQRVYACFYLGSGSYEQIEQRPAPVSFEPGIIRGAKLETSVEKIKELSSEFNLAILSDRPRFETDSLLNYLNIKHFFQDKNIITSQDMEVEKPSPRVLILAMRKLEIEPTQTKIITADENFTIERLEEIGFRSIARSF